MMYQAYETQNDLCGPFRALSHWSLPVMQGPALAQWPAVRTLSAALRVIELARVTHARPAWRIDAVETPSGSGVMSAVVEEAVLVTPFCTLRRFAKPGVSTPQPRLLVVAPMSGHFATLLRDTVRTLLQDHDVYITDWHNVRDVPLTAGRFGLDEYTQHLIDFLAHLGPATHLLAVCQPCVSALAATAVMAEDQHPAAPASLTLMAGPIDCRISPTAVNELAMTRPIDWFEDKLISIVPWRHRGGGRRVYPGFVQLSAFIGMNRERHVDAFKAYYQHLVADEFDQAEITRTFYEEYMAVSDLSADFYLETVRLVFQEHALPQGELLFKGRRVNPAAIRRTALLTIEGERDDICAVGQTLAAQDLTPGLKPYMRRHYVQAGVGHYGVFSGRRWQKQIYPLVRDWVQLSG